MHSKIIIARSGVANKLTITHSAALLLRLFAMRATSTYRPTYMLKTIMNITITIKEDKNESPSSVARV